MESNKKNQQNSNWSIEMQDYSKIDIKVLSKILSDAEIYFEGLYDDGNSLTNKVFTILSIIISAIGILITFLVGGIGVEQNLSQKVILLAVLILTIICAYCIYLLIKIIFPRKINVKGEKPKPIDFYTLEKIDIEEQHKGFLFDSIEAVQSKIDFNEVVIQERINIFKNVLILSSTTFLIVLGIIIILLLTS